MIQNTLDSKDVKGQNLGATLFLIVARPDILLLP